MFVVNVVSISVCIVLYVVHAFLQILHSGNEVLNQFLPFVSMICNSLQCQLV